MKALSIRQPWLWCILFAGKDIENRTWWTSHRGELYLHASKTFDMDGYRWIKENFRGLYLPTPGNYKAGGLVGKVSVMDCVEHSTSKWFFGPFGIIMQQPEQIQYKPMNGKLGIFQL